MINLLVQFFIKNGHISLPGIGTLQLTKNESFWDDGKLIAPNEYIQLDHKNFDQSNILIKYLSDELDVTQEEANTQFMKFLEPILSQQIASLNFGNLGTFHKNGAKITWNSIYKSDDYFNNIAPNLYQANDENSESKTRKDHSCLIWSILISVISIALIIYKNISH
jgi:hypothetical protein